MTLFANTYLTPSECTRYDTTSLKVDVAPEYYRSDIPIRAKSVCLAERPRSRYGRPVKSADLARQSRQLKQFYHGTRPQSTIEQRRKVSYRKSSNVLPKASGRKPPAAKLPCAVSVQTLSIPMKYADVSLSYRAIKYSTSTRRQSHLCNTDRIDNVKTKPTNLTKQVSESKKQCRADARRRETENKLLLRISEAEQISDFERILNSNAILSERARGHVWRPNRTSLLPSTADARPRSSYSLHAVSEAYHYLYRRHQESLQPLIEKYRQGHESGCDPATCDQGTSKSILGRNWYDELQDLSKFYDEDNVLQEQIELITDQIITEEVKSVGKLEQCDAPYKNFNVNLSSLISVNATGDSFSAVNDREEAGASLEIIQGRIDEEIIDGKEWLAPIMSANSSESRQNSQENDDVSVERLAQNFTTVHLDDNNTNVPTITFSNCCEGCSSTDLPNNTNITEHLAVPSIEGAGEARPPMM